MTLVDVVTAVERTTRSPSYTSDDILAVLEDGRKYVASKVLLEPLEDSGEFTALPGLNTVPVPATWEFDRALVSATVEGRDITVLNSIEQLRRHCPTFDSDQEIGEVKYITTHASQLVYYPLPRLDTLIKCFFHKKVDTNEDLYEYPEGLAKPVLHAYACWQIFSSIEDGVDGSKVNTTYWLSIFTQELEYLEERVSSGQSRPFPDRVGTWI